MSFFKRGDVAEVPEISNSQWKGLGVVVEPDDDAPSVILEMFTGKYKGQRGGFHIATVNRVHGKVSISAREAVPVPAPMRIYEI